MEGFSTGIEKRSFKLIRTFSFIFFGLISWAGFTVFSSWGGTFRTEGLTFSVDVKDKSLEEALEEISKVTGYLISVNKEWADFPVTARLSNVTVKEGLRRLLKDFNYSLIIRDSEKEISVEILEPNIRSFGERLTMPERKADLPRQRQGDPLPPPEGGERGVTQQEWREMRGRAKRIDPKDLEVIPPEKSGKRGITQGELEEMEALAKKINAKDLEVIPPEAPGQPEITQRELEMIKLLHRKGGDTSETEVIPPEP